MSIDQSKTIDFCTVRAAEKRCILTISDHLEWSDPEHLPKLQQKINNYLAFIESGEIYKARPAAKGLAVEISVHCRYTPEDADNIRFLQLARDAIKNAGLKFWVTTDTEEFIIPVTEG